MASSSKSSKSQSKRTSRVEDEISFGNFVLPILPEGSTARYKPLPRMRLNLEQQTLLDGLWRMSSTGSKNNALNALSFYFHTKCQKTKNFAYILYTGNQPGVYVNYSTMIKYSDNLSKFQGFVTFNEALDTACRFFNDADFFIEESLYKEGENLRRTIQKAQLLQEENDRLVREIEYIEKRDSTAEEYVPFHVLQRRMLKPSYAKKFLEKLPYGIEQQILSLVSEKHFEQLMMIQYILIDIAITNKHQREVNYPSEFALDVVQQTGEWIWNPDLGSNNRPLQLVADLRFCTEDHFQTIKDCYFNGFLWKIIFKITQIDQLNFLGETTHNRIAQFIVSWRLFYELQIQSQTKVEALNETLFSITDYPDLPEQSIGTGYNPGFHRLILHQGNSVSTHFSHNVRLQKIMDNSYFPQYSRRFLDVEKDFMYLTLIQETPYKRLWVPQTEFNRITYGKNLSFCQEISHVDIGELKNRRESDAAAVRIMECGQPLDDDVGYENYGSPHDLEDLGDL